MRHEFPEPVKHALAKRAGYRCSFPSCGRMTIGPSDESETAVSSTGTAAHIIAASAGPGARRVVPGTSPEYIKSIENGIWMCNFHGTLVDTDETRFTISMLKRMRQVAELRARLLHELGPNVSYGDTEFHAIELAPEVAELFPDGTEVQVVRNLLEDCGISSAWGDDISHAVRDFCIEHIRNAKLHGGASIVHIEISKRKISLIDDGTFFDPWTLRIQEQKRGGHFAFEQLFDTGPHMICAAVRLSGKNRVDVARALTFPEVADLVPCKAVVEGEWAKGYSIDETGLRLDFFEAIGVFYVICPDILTYSNAPLLKEIGAMLGGRQFVLVVDQRCVSGWVATYLDEASTNISGCIKVMRL